MPDPAAAVVLSDAELRLSRVPTADLAAAALEAGRLAGIRAPDLIIVAVPPGHGQSVADALELDAAVERARLASPARA